MDRPSVPPISREALGRADSLKWEDGTVIFFDPADVDGPVDERICKINVSLSGVIELHLVRPYAIKIMP